MNLKGWRWWWRMGKCQHNTGFGILVLAAADRSVWGRVSTGRGWKSVMQGRGGWRGLIKVFLLAAIMHGVAGDDHRWGHGDGSTPHSELIGNRIVSTAAAGARLTRCGSWKKEWSVMFNSQGSEWCKSTTQICVTRTSKLKLLIVLFCTGGHTLDDSCAHDGAHPGVSMVDNSCVHCNQTERS